MIRFLAKYINPYLWLLLLDIAFVAVMCYFNVIGIMGKVQEILDVGVAGGDMAFIKHEGGIMLLYTVLAALFMIGQSLVSAMLTAHVISDIRRVFYEKTVSMTEQDYLRFGAATLINREMSSPYDIQVLLINLFRTSMMAPVIVIFVLVAVFLKNKMLFLVLFGFFLVAALIMIFFGSKAHAPFQTLQEKNDRVATLMKEKFSGVRSIRAFNNERLEEEKLFDADKTACEQSIKANARINFLAPSAMVIMNWAVVVIYYFGSQQLRAGIANISDIILVFTYLGYLISVTAVIPVLINIIPKASASINRINEVLDYQPMAKQHAAGKTDGIKEGDVEFDHVIFGYTGAVNVIADVSFRARPGKVTAIIGTTGSGKTTIANLLCGMYEMNFGDIRIDGTSIREYRGDYLRSRISYATQRPLVFQDTVKNNVTVYSDEIKDDRIKKACAATCFDEVITKLSDGLDTEIALGGMNISGGQRQRLSLARTVAKNADIYIFDDSFSALDAKTEEKSRRQIGEMLSGKTVIMVAQKISSIVNADNIIVLEKGRIVGQGTHENLLSSCEEYRAIYRTQYYIETGGGIGDGKEKCAEKNA